MNGTNAEQYEKNDFDLRTIERKFKRFILLIRMVIENCHNYFYIMRMKKRRKKKQM